MSSTSQLALTLDSTGEVTGGKGKLTEPPMLRQYRELKERFAEHIVLFQVGDFYEIFFDDAHTVADVLRIRLTTRDKNQPNPTPMCGVPVHALDNYLPRLLEQGLSCVVVDQQPAVGGGPIRREIARIVTPGVRLDGLDERAGNFLAAALFFRNRGAFAYGDTSTGVLHLTSTDSLEELVDTVERISPAELLLPSLLFATRVNRGESWWKGLRAVAQRRGIQVRLRPFGEERRERGVSRVLRLFPSPADLAVTLQALDRESLAALAAFAEFVEEVSFGSRISFSRFSVTEQTKNVFIDAATCRNLELFPARSDGDGSTSLLGTIDMTKTSMGGRLLREWISNPSRDLEVITGRLDVVEELVGRNDLRRNLRESLVTVRDLERLLARIASLRASPRDLAALRDSLPSLPTIAQSIAECSSLASLAGEFDPLEDISAHLARVLADDPPGKVADGGVFREGFCPELDETRLLQRETHTLLSRLEAAEREQTGIPVLKVRYTGVFGYFIEVTKTHLAKVPPHYERRQTLANAERFVTSELKEFEARVLQARDRQLELEQELFENLRTWVGEHAGRIRATAVHLAVVDVYAALAEVAAVHRYVRPKFTDGSELVIREGRHPLVERVLGAERFVPNDTYLDGTGRRFAVLTGPNMGGKSTYLRQVALVQLLGQMGSFVPAREATLGIVDRIFTRIGSADDITRGDSTFMVEMREAAAIIRRATSRSLVLIDEIGRGTATTDGLALATAIAEWIVAELRCRTIFATHFHEMTALPHEGVFCLSVGVIEEGEAISFTHRIEERVGSRSYGLEVARLAGFPEALLRRAAEVFGTLSHAEPLALPVSSYGGGDTCLRERLGGLNPERLTPVEALLEIIELRKLCMVRDSA